MTPLEFNPDDTAVPAYVTVTTAEAAQAWGLTWQAARLRLASGWAVRVDGRPARWRIDWGLLLAARYAQPWALAAPVLAEYERRRPEAAPLTEAPAAHASTPGEPPPGSAPAPLPTSRGGPTGA